MGGKTIPWENKPMITRYSSARPMLVVAALVALTAGSASAWSTMRCGNRLIDLGDPLYKVKHLCGEPAQEDTSVEYRIGSRVLRGCSKDSGGRIWCGGSAVEGVVEIPIHHLIYDFGRNRFVFHLLFEGSRLTALETGDYGVK